MSLSLGRDLSPTKRVRLHLTTAQKESALPRVPLQSGRAERRSDPRADCQSDDEYFSVRPLMKARTSTYLTTLFSHACDDRASAQRYNTLNMTILQRTSANVLQGREARALRARLRRSPRDSSCEHCMRGGRRHRPAHRVAPSDAGLHRPHTHPGGPDHSHPPSDAAAALSTAAAGGAGGLLSKPSVD